MYVPCPLAAEECTLWLWRRPRPAGPPRWFARSRDRGAKRQLYQREGVAEYWIVDVDMRRVERWRLNEDVGAILTDRLVWQPDPEVPPLAIDLAEFFRDATGED